MRRLQQGDRVEVARENGFFVSALRTAAGLRTEALLPDSTAVKPMGWDDDECVHAGIDGGEWAWEGDPQLHQTM